jgi:hypothetical protein
MLLLFDSRSRRDSPSCDRQQIGGGRSSIPVGLSGLDGFHPCVVERDDWDDGRLFEERCERRRCRHVGVVGLDDVDEGLAIRSAQG